MAEHPDVGEKAGPTVEEFQTVREICALQKKKIEDLTAQNQQLTKKYHNSVRNQGDHQRELQAVEDEKASLRTQIADRDAQIADLESNAAFITGLMDEYVQENKEWRSKREINHRQIHALDAQVKQRDMCVAFLIAVLRRKIATSRAAQTALKAAYMGSNTEQKAALAQLIKVAKENPHKMGILQELVFTLREVGIWVDPDDQQLTPFAAQTQYNDLVEDFVIDDNVLGAPQPPAT